MKKLYYMLILALLSISCQKTYSDIDDPGWDNGDEETSSEIKIMTYNIKYCSPLGSDVPDLKAVAEVIKEQNPDIVFLQEIDRNTTRSGKVDQPAELARLTKLPFTYYSKTQDYQGGEVGIAFLSRYSLSETRTTPLSRVIVPGEYVGYSVLSQAQIQVNGKKVNIANTHMALTQQNRDLQVNDIKNILAASNYPTILAGDLNATPENATILSFLEFGFTSTCKIGCNTIPSNQPNKQLDYILFRQAEKFNIISHEVISGTQASDHLPVVSVMEIK